MNREEYVIVIDGLYKIIKDMEQDLYFANIRIDNLTKELDLAELKAKEVSNE